MNSAPAVKKIMRIVFVVKSILGFSMGVYEVTCGVYFYERFGAAIDPRTAILLATGLLALRQGMITLLEMPTGALADTIGRVRVVMISWVARIAFFVCLSTMWFCHNLFMAVAVGFAASIFWSINYTCFNGAFSAWCVDYLKENALEYPYSMLVSRSFNYYMTALAIGTPIGILFYLRGYPFVIYAAVGVLSLIGAGYSWMQMKENRAFRFLNHTQISVRTIFSTMCDRMWNSISACKQRPELFWVVMTYGSFMFMMNIISFLWPVFLKDTTGSGEWSMMWIGLALGAEVVCAISSRVFMGVSKRIDALGNPVSRLTLFSWIFSGISILSALVVIVNSYAAAYQMNGFSLLVVTVIVIMVCYGFMAACFETLVNHYIGDSNDKERATIISSGSLIRGVLFVVLALPSTGSSAAGSPIYWAIPAVLLLVSGSMSLVAVAKARRRVPVGNVAL